MVMKAIMFNRLGIIFVFLFALANTYPARAGDALTPINFKGIYQFAFDGLPIGKMGIELEQTPQHYAATSDIMTTGLVGAFVKHLSHTTVDGSGQHYHYTDITYESHYQTRKKKKYVQMVTQNGKLTLENLIPPENHESRSEVDEALKNNAVDPLSFLPQLRYDLFEARAKNEGHFTLNAYDGRRLTQVDFAIAGQKNISYNGQDVRVIDVTASRKQIAGFTKSEIDDFDPHEPILHIYFTDDARLIPIRLEARLMLGILSATLAKECTTGESCLFGIKE